jgi:hypothetical protein
MATTPKPGFLTRVQVIALNAILCMWGVQAMATDGLITMRSSFGPQDTVRRLEAAVKAKGMTIFADIDHAAGPQRLGWRCGPPSY